MSLARKRITIESLPPEILHDILVYLKHCKSNLVNTCLVSKKFRSASLPLLYETVILRFDYDGRRLQKQFASILAYEHAGLTFVKNFGIQGSLDCQDQIINYGSVLQKVKESGKKTMMFSCLMLSVLRRFKDGQLQNFMLVNVPLFVNMLQGAWIFGPDDLQNTGSIEGGLFTFLNTKAQLRELHLGGIKEMSHVANILNNFDQISNKLRGLTIQLQDTRFLEELMRSPENWQKYQRSYSLEEVDDGFFEGIRQIDCIFPLEQLEQLKFTCSGDISSTLDHMTGKCTHLKVFYLWGGTNETALSKYLVSLPQLKELVLNIHNAQLANLDNLQLDRHSQSLTKLYLRFQTDEDQPSGSWLLRLLERGCSFPKLAEVALSMSIEEFVALRDQDYLLPQLEFLWLLQSKSTWCKEKFELDNMIPVLRPLFRYHISSPKWRFFAIGDRPRNDNWPIIYEFCESLTVQNKICTGLEYVTHRTMFEHNPDLTLLNCFEIWLPWEEERNFVIF
ncbi:hypothetical protein TWF192_000934 [Orbilia oligospora]|uniref:F-box domain-containing protein n=1 Tax=Orbilia oligospora TaxID=2813651 RepID=A0A6G1MGL4_ORBOL|nr:hypothetical protein TWF191_005561 [Orbilia oligospora]KAF3257644.1 hypothetical protein TWF192_000934 [Orbilia oligospora]